MKEGRARRRTVLFLLLIASLAVVHTFSFPAAHADDDRPFGYHMQMKAPVTPVTAGYLDRVISRAESDGAELVLIQLDTPGGLLSSTRTMTDRILNAQVPVVVWVGPSGARAASAGVFITYAGHVAGMAEGTNIGAAHPVQAGGGDLSDDMKQKVVNDAVKQLQSFAELRDRNRTIAEKFVRESLSLTAREAVDKNVVEFLADSPEEVWAALDGRTVEVNDRTVTLDGGMERREIPMTWQEEFLKTLINPNLVYLFAILGVLGFMAELSNPGIGVGGIFSAVGFLLAMYGLSILPVNWVGASLVILGLGLMISDLVIPSFGLLTVGGLSCFFVGSTMLFQHSFSVSLPLVVAMTAVAGGAVLLLGLLIFFGQTRKVQIGEEDLEGREGIVKKALDPEGMVHVHGEYWTARDVEDRRISTGVRIRVKRQTDRELIVEPLDPSKLEPDSEHTSP